MATSDLILMRWSSREISLLRKLCLTAPCEEIAEKIGRTPGAIYLKATELGLRKNEFWTEREINLLKKLLH